LDSAKTFHWAASTLPLVRKRRFPVLAGLPVVVKLAALPTMGAAAATLIPVKNNLRDMAEVFMNEEYEV
jgi:hypothetical protein